MGVGFVVQGLGFRVLGLKCRIWGFGAPCLGGAESQLSTVVVQRSCL